MVLRSHGDVGHKAFEQLQLQALRAVVGCFMVVAVSRHLLLPYEGTTMLVVRMVAVIVGAALLKLVKQENAWKYGIGLTVFFKVAVTLRTFATSTTEISVLTTGLSAPHRVMPVMCAIFGGVWYSAAMAVVSLAEMFVLAHVHGHAIQKLAGGADSNLAAILEQLQLTTHSVVVTECFYVVMSTLFGALLVRHYRDVLHKLGQALQARQLFITNMVRTREYSETLQQCARGQLALTWSELSNRCHAVCAEPRDPHAAHGRVGYRRHDPPRPQHRGAAAGAAAAHL